MKLRRKLIRENYKEVFVTNDDDSIKDAKQELLEMIIDHLPKQFPDKFESKDGGVYNKIGLYSTYCITINIVYVEIQTLNRYVKIIELID